MQLWGKTSEVRGKKQNLISADTEGHFCRSRPCNRPNDCRCGLQSRCLWTAGWGLGGRPAPVKSRACSSPSTSFSTTVLNTEGTHLGTHIVPETKQADTDFSLWVFGWTSRTSIGKSLGAPAHEMQEHVGNEGKKSNNLNNIL